MNSPTADASSKDQPRSRLTAVASPDPIAQGARPIAVALR